MVEVEWIIWGNCTPSVAAFLRGENEGKKLGSVSVMGLHISFQGDKTSFALAGFSLDSAGSFLLAEPLRDSVRGIWRCPRLQYVEGLDFWLMI